MTNTNTVILTDKSRQAIRSAWRKGKRTVEIDGVKFNLSKAAGSTLYAFSKTDEKPAGKRESYILVKPADGSLTPIAQVTFKENRS